MNGSHPQNNTVTLADYLLTRLKQLGVGAIHGVPGDYNLTLLDYIEPAGLLWVGSTNELNAGYAADGYARIKGLGALITTFGVGELSAINAIAGAYTERAAVVHIVGTPPRDSQDERKMIHHTLGDGDYSHFAQMSAHVTVAQANLLDPRTAPKQIDDALEQCILHSRPVYIEVPVDVVAVPVPADRLESNIQISQSLPSPAFEAAITKLTERLYAAKQPVILVDCETRPLGLMNSVRQLIESTRWPTFTTSSGKSLVDETLPNVYGIYQGRFAAPKTKSVMDNSDLVLFFGPHQSTTNSYSLTALPRTDVTISFTFGGIKVASDMYRDVSAKQVLDYLLNNLDFAKLNADTKTDVDLPRERNLSFSDVSDEQEIKQDKVWRLIGNFLQPGDILMGETGTPGYGVREMSLPPHTRLFTPTTWLSIGYMLPASQGAALAQRELMASSNYHGIKDARTVLLIGDGSFQMTVQELATIIRHNLNVVIFLINNDGYTIERCIHGLRQGYNDITPWRYLKAPEFFGAPENTYTNSAKTYGELKQVLEDKSLTDAKGLRMVEVFLDREDAPVGPLVDLLNKQKDKAD
ncbi:thiamine pyrophosphate enzyme [Exophiala viscosa]|uniref:Pyruvate decarboxylase n=1 Tax=Exophiala viscosa TaxID=2486360 RepID=A0AAN6DME4_9EURO|nr:thiamine pyrophosphate enzyme [Exophiala viscosa]